MPTLWCGLHYVQITAQLGAASAMHRWHEPPLLVRGVGSPCHNHNCSDGTCTETAAPVSCFHPTGAPSQGRISSTASGFQTVGNEVGFGVEICGRLFILSSSALYPLPVLRGVFTALVSSLRSESFRADRSTKNKITCQVSQLLQTKCPLQKRNE